MDIMPATAEIITIGDEILYGQTLDTNSHWISAELDRIGIKVLRKLSIGDNEEEILRCLKETTARADIVLITGGLGPTSDDKTKECLAKFYHVSLQTDPQALKNIEELFYRVNRELTDLNRQQADLPANCTMIPNKLGTAPGMWFEDGGKVLISMPGVPYEMKGMMTDMILEKLNSKFVREVHSHHIIRTIGVPESKLAQLIEDWEKSLPTHVGLAYLPSPGQVKLRLTATGADRAVLASELKSLAEKIPSSVSKYIYGTGEEEIEAVLGKKLVAHRQTLAVAESCTGGYLSHLLTSVAGSSAYFKGAVIAYSNETKEQVLGVPRHVIEKFGAVSEETVKAMAEGVRNELGSDIGLSVSGIAGPDGGTIEKPVGTVWIGFADAHKSIAKKFNFTKNRMINIQLSSYQALNMVRLNIQPD